MEIPVTEIVLWSFLTVMVVVFGCGALLSFWMDQTMRMPRSCAIFRLSGILGSSVSIPKMPATKAKSVPWPR